MILRFVFFMLTPVQLLGYISAFALVAYVAGFSIGWNAMKKMAGLPERT